MNKLKQLIIHLRFPFGIMLFPVFLHAITYNSNLNFLAAGLVFFILHFLVYPSSNAYNSFMDQDTTSIGGIENPPPVPNEIFAVSLIFDLLALGLCAYFLGATTTLLLFSYIAMSRLYSYRGIRLKKYGVISFFIIGLFQGVLIFILTQTSIDHNYFSTQTVDFVALGIAFLLPAAGYPISQIYQHDADKKDGVTTISMKLGVIGTFIFSGILFGALLVLLLYQFAHNYTYIGILLLFVLPAIVFFNIWFLQVLKNKDAANYKNTMRMNLLGALGFNLYFVFVFLHQQLEWQF